MGGQAGASQRVQGERRPLSAKNPTKGPGPQCRGFFWEKQTCLSFHQLLLKQHVGFDSLLFHPKQMINKQTLVSSEYWNQDPGPTAEWTHPPGGAGPGARCVGVCRGGGQAPSHVS